MPRDITIDAGIASAKIEVHPVFFVHLDIVGDPLYGWTGPMDVQLYSVPGDSVMTGSPIWISTGTIGQISDIVQDSNGAVSKITLGLVGDFSTSPFAALLNAPQNWSERRAIIWMAFIQTGTINVVQYPFRLLTGRINHLRATDGETASLLLECANRDADGDRASGWRFTDVHHQKFWPGDRSMEYIEALQNKEIRWGLADDKVSRTSGAGGGSGTNGYNGNVNSF